MCVTSMVGDHYRDKWQDRPWGRGIYPVTPNPGELNGQPPFFVINGDGPSREEFDKLKAEVEEMKALLKRAKAYDEANNEPACEIEDKMNFLRQVAKLVGVDLDDAIGKPTS